MTAPKLKLCPFCGGEAKWIDIKSGENFGGSCIYCTNCQASTNVSFQFKENLISAWNTRADLPQAAIAAAMMGAVKPLEWHGEGYHLLARFSYSVDATYGRHDQLIWIAACGERYIGEFDSEGEAKVAAEADWQTHAKAALSIPAYAMSASDVVEIDIRSVFMAEIEKAAAESPWIPTDYMMNVVISDICAFLREDRRPDATTALQAMITEAEKRGRDGATDELGRRLGEIEAGYLSPEYAYPQPVGSIIERMVVGKCREAVRAMKDGE